MATLNDDMDDAQDWVPLTEADAIAMAPGYYEIDEENVLVKGLHLTVPSQTQTPPDGRWVNRAIGGSAAAAHDSGTALVRYYTDAPGGGPGGSGAVIGLTGMEPGLSFPVPSGFLAAHPVQVLAHVRTLVVAAAGTVLSNVSIPLAGFTDVPDGVVVNLDVWVTKEGGADSARVNFSNDEWDGGDSEIFFTLTGTPPTIQGDDLSVAGGSLVSAAGGVFHIEAAVFVGVD